MLNNIKDYLPLLNAVIITDLLFMIFIAFKLINSKVLKEWYEKYTLSAVIADVLIIMIGLLIANKLYYYIFKEFSLFKFIILALIIQIIHDILFYILITIIPKGKNRMIDTFKDYAKEVSFFAIIGDSLMIIFACILCYYLIKMDTNINIIILIVSLYIMSYMLYNN
jgi:uncharacterized protein YacL